MPDDNDRQLPELEQRLGGRFARVILDETELSLSDMKKAIRVQEKLGHNKLISTILIELGFLTETEKRRLLRKIGRSFRIGELLAELDYISIAQLREAEQKIAETPGLRMGETLIGMGMIDDRQLAQALSDQLGIPLVHLDVESVDRNLLKQFPIKFMSRHLTIPFEIGQTKVSVATSNPLNNAAIAEIEQRLGKKVVVSIAAESTLRSLLNKLEASGNVGDQKDQVADIVDSILLSALRDHASDVHIEPLANVTRVRFRLDGVLIHKLDLPTELSRRVTARIKVLAEMDIADTRRHQDGRVSRAIAGIDVDFRVSTYVTVFGENLVIRVLRRDGGLKSIEQINMSRGVLERFKHDALDVPSGVIIITGPTGSGKTTTMYAAIDYLNRPTTKIITLEDPVEYVVDGIMQCSVDTKAGRTFDMSLKAVVRQDPDIIVLGEVRDRSTAQVAVQAALTGHKVLTTFHTEDSIGGLLRLVDMGIETFLISSTVVSILAQRLIRTICKDCRQAYMPNRRIAGVLGIDHETLRNHTFYRGTGCGTCYGTGYNGRIGLHELLVLNEDVRDAIIRKKTSHEVRTISCQSTDLLSLMEDGVYKILKGHTTIDEVYRVAPRAMAMRGIEEINRLMGEEV